jgi:2-oxoglutarate ferredoxin oxidoreductase subunit beta
LPSDYDPEDWDKAMQASRKWGDGIPIGVIYRNEKTSFEQSFSVLKQGPLVGRDVNRSKLKEVMEKYA